MVIAIFQKVYVNYNTYNKENKINDTYDKKKYILLYGTYMINTYI